ncbi:iron complex transport system ATP-binding protein [Microbacterium resistens]|uniref:Iron complex transport system ATP-binding protein n=1 Tax=Microbacterium resistens TaxID=156977 RepID=A0ABU1SDT3_9MICO|nr:ABC transporter ATP-binding protein [Microbacterium resistens]MDR6867766.1 iron complex transport system ATP-binding protein [Microbacterium resistens]
MTTISEDPRLLPTPALSAEGVRVGYDGRVICDGVDLRIEPGSYTAILGPNACGKSTLLRAMARVLPIAGGRVVLDGADIAALPAKELARRLGLLPQTSLAPEGIRVADLVARGRYPHQRLFDRWSTQDERAVADALRATGTTALSGRLVDELSGGQRQRAWLAMVLAQQTPLLLLDEPTTFLDIAHQYALLELFERLRTDHGRTVVVVLHDLNQAARYADHLIVMKDGAVVVAGPPTTVITAELVEEVYGLPCRVEPDPETGTPMVIPRAALPVLP